MSALDSVPLAATVGAACTALGGVVGAWAKGRAQTKTASVTAHAREHSATEETTRATLALVPALIARITALEAQVARHTVEIAEGAALGSITPANMWLLSQSTAGAHFDGWLYKVAAYQPNRRPVWSLN